MDWLKISEIGNSKLVKTMLIWLFLTPILAKSLAPINSIHFGFLEENKNINLSLPFSWEIFFFCALAFTIANIIYIYKCPILIRKYKNYSDFKEKDNSLYLMVSYFEEHSKKIKLINDLSYKTFVVVSTYSPSIDIVKEWTSDDTSNVNWNKGIDSLKHSKDDYKTDIFSSFRIILADISPFFSWLCFSLYTMGYLGIVWVIYENILFVYNQL